MIRVKLNVIGGKHAGQVIPLNQKKFLIGREQDCQLRPNSELVSRHHCIFSVDDFSVRVRDLGSTNGTLVNGERIRKEVVLQPGDRVVVGSLEFEVTINAAETAALPTDSKPDRDETVIAGAAGSDTLMEMNAITTPAGSKTGEQPATVAEQPEPAFLPTPANEVAPQAESPSTPPQQNISDTTVISQPIMMPGQVPYQPMMPQMGYPPMYGGGYPYPGMPQQMPMYPQQGYGYPGGYPQQPPMMPTPEPAAAAATETRGPEVSLPDPSQTGAKDPAPAPKTEAPGASEATAKKKDEPSNQSAAAIIQQHMHRRPGG